MRTKFKKVISTCLVAVMLLSTAVIAPITAFAGETQAVSTGAISGDFEYDIYDYSENTIAITGYTGSATEVTIPSEIDGKKVTNISWRAFKSCTSITSVTIPDSVTKIDYDAFAGCTSLTSITILGGVTYIDGYAFSGCTSLESVTIPDSVTYIGRYAFKDCTSLKSVTIPASVENIGEYAFGEDCGVFIKITGYKGTVAESYANKYGHEFISLGEVQTEPIKYTILDDGTAIITKYTGSATEITIPSELEGKKVTSIGENAFYDCRSLKSITIPDSVTSIGNYAFYNCRGLTSITIPDSVTEIGWSAFYNCAKLASITIPDSVTKIGDDAFQGTAWYGNQPDGVVYAGKVLYEYKGEMPQNTTITLKDGTKGIGVCAFYKCKSLKSITIPDSVTSIGDWSFLGCTGLSSVTISGGVTEIGLRAFEDCTSLTSVTIPDSVTSIGEDAFENTAWYDNQPDGVVYAGKVLYLYKGKMPKNTSITVKDSTKSISASAFSDCENLTSITIPNTVTSIGRGAFSSCISLKNIKISDGVTSIDDFAFEYCENLTSITIPDSVTKIGYAAFLACKSLTSVTIPDSVTSIGNYAFGYDYNIYDDGDNIKIDGFRITGSKGSAAERYANENGFKFISLDEAPTKDPEALGDVNADGKVNIKDATTIQKSAASLVTLTEKQNKAADVNADGKVNVNDATAIQKYTAGIDTGFKIGK